MTVHRHCVPVYAVDVVSDHRDTARALKILTAAGAEPYEHNGSIVSWWIEEGDNREDAGRAAAAKVAALPGCTHADWWPPQPVHVTPPALPFDIPGDPFAEAHDRGAS